MIVFAAGASLTIKVEQRKNSCREYTFSGVDCWKSNVRERERERERGGVGCIVSGSQNGKSELSL